MFFFLLSVGLVFLSCCRLRRNSGSKEDQLPRGLFAASTGVVWGAAQDAGKVRIKISVIALDLTSAGQTKRAAQQHDIGLLIILASMQISRKEQFQR